MGARGKETRTSGREGRTRWLSGAGVVGGLIWAFAPVGVVVAITGWDVPVVRSVAGGFLGLVGVSVFLMGAGVIGLHRFATGRYGRLGRYGAGIMGLGLLLLLPGSVFPSGFLPVSISSRIPVVFFAGLFVLAIGSLLVGVSAWRTNTIPAPAALFLAAALPAGLVVGGVVMVITGQPIALAAGLMIPFGLAWAIVEGYVWREVSRSSTGPSRTSETY